MMECSGILIVDDNEINRDICAMNLEQIKAPMFFAENGHEGLRQARQHMPDLILLDLMMPVMNGMEMLKELRKDQQLKHIAVLVLSAKTETQQIVDALNAGANDYLKKPFEEEEMVARVNTLLRNRYLEKRLAEDLDAGARMQQKFLTDSVTGSQILRDVGIETVMHNQPYASISGDFYHTFALPGNKAGFFLGDSCGHGLPAALISMRAIGLLQHLAAQDMAPDAILSALNGDLFGVLPRGFFVAGCCLVFDRETVKICNGGQPYAIHASAQNTVEIQQNSMPIAMHANYPYHMDEFSFHPGDRLLLYTDGLVDQTNIDEETFGGSRLHRCMERFSRQSSLIEMKENILCELDLFKATNPHDDDVTFIMFEKSR